MIKNPYQDWQRKIAFENAIDCWIYGMSKSYCDFQGLDGQSADEVWQTAFETLASMDI